MFLYFYLSTVIYSQQYFLVKFYYFLLKRQLIYLSIPLLIGSIFQQFYNTIDSIIVGTYVGHDAFAAIGISGTVMNLFIFIIIGCCTGVSIITAQLYGE